MRVGTYDGLPSHRLQPAHAHKSTPCYHARSRKHTRPLRSAQYLAENNDTNESVYPVYPQLVPLTNPSFPAKCISHSERPRGCACLVAPTLASLDE